jgi:hypothetical protein
VLFSLLLLVFLILLLLLPLFSLHAFIWDLVFVFIKFKSRYLRLLHKQRLLLNPVYMVRVVKIVLFTYQK